LSRFHAERTSLMEVLRAYTAGDLGRLAEIRSSDRWTLFEGALSNGFKYLQGDFGPLSGRDLIATLQVDLRVNATDWDTIKFLVDQLQSYINSRVTQYFTIVEGDNFVGDKFENISNSTIINRSHVQSSLNSLASSGQDGLAEALRAIASHLEKQRATADAADTFEDLALEVAKPERRPSRIRAFWDQLVSLAPSVATLAGAAKVITALF
jgi:hypothetical protein